MKKYFFLLLVAFSTYSSIANASIIDTVETYSNAMKKKIKAVVVRPDNYESLKEMPVVYLLHGYSDGYNGWLKKGDGFQKTADLYNIMIVCPDGGYSSWYWDSPVDDKFKYETYVSKELVGFIDSKYKTIKDRKGRAITGLSMGGHGGLYLGIKHQDVFGAAGSMSGGVDIRPFPNNWDMAKRLGSYAEKPENWEKNTVINLLHLLTPNSLALIIDCGTDDFFYKVNENLHQELVYRNIPHDYISRPGGHSWPYWKNAVQYQMLFMSNFFNKVSEK
ncbi:alpha/beta hydrolase family protein [Dyadobacter sp. CY312]|uniref:alpha/beta hydrolase n=1 Tax=Dyadobacter sp. CY312 TaxID=2907303 RepID=UPI001F3BD897|nr:alpha/beta hydrolase family protein [Dyadobacter sp. CY312]MCE7040226.1 esterase family protein [Dyadobacter sp. CY312]